MEEWKQITPWPGGSAVPQEYEVSNEGRVRRISDGFEPKIRHDRLGVPVVFLTSQQGMKQVGRRVAHLVAEAFLVQPTVKVKRVRHKNGDLDDCRVENIIIHSWTLWEY